MTKQETNEKIELAAIRLFANNGYNGTSTKRIAEEAGVSELTIFRNYGTKDDLFRQCFFRQIPDKWLKELHPDPNASIEVQVSSLCDALYKTFMDRIDLIRIVQRDLTEHPELLEHVREAKTRIWKPVSEYVQQLSQGIGPIVADKVAFQLWVAYFGIAAMIATIGQESLPFLITTFNESMVSLYSLFIRQFDDPSVKISTIPQNGSC